MSLACELTQQHPREMAYAHGPGSLLRVRAVNVGDLSLHCLPYGSLSPIAHGGRLNVGSQKKEVPVNSSDVWINGVAVGILDYFPALWIWFRFYSQGLGNDGAALIMMVPAFMVPDNRVSPYVQDPAVY